MSICNRLENCSRFPTLRLNDTLPTIAHSSIDITEIKKLDLVNYIVDHDNINLRTA